MSPQPTWKPEAEQGYLDYEERKDLPNHVFAFPRARKEPLLNASHVLRALARIKHVRDVSDEERDLAFANIRKAGEYYGIRVVEQDWREVGVRPLDAQLPRNIYDEESLEQPVKTLHIDPIEPPEE